MTKEVQTLPSGGLPNADVMSAFEQIGTQNEFSKVLKELFEEKKIYLISDLSEDEIKLATRIYMIAEMKKITIWKTGLFFYMKLLLSKNRKSRSEIIEAFKGTRQNSFMQRMNPFNRNRGGDQW